MIQPVDALHTPSFAAVPSRMSRGRRRLGHPLVTVLLARRETHASHTQLAVVSLCSSADRYRRTASEAVSREGRLQAHGSRNGGRIGLSPMRLPLMQPLQLHFHGPLSFLPGEASLFHSPYRDVSGVYLWTIKSDVDGHYHIHYIGEAEKFARRHREHLVHVLGLNYGIIDPDNARRGVVKWLWPGLWRDKSAEGPGRLLERYARLADDVFRYVSALTVFVAPLDVARGDRRHVEGCLSKHLRTAHPEVKTLYPDDNRALARATRLGVRLELTADAPIAGLDPMLEI
jgi:hypothetical protein